VRTRNLPQCEKSNPAATGRKLTTSNGGGESKEKKKKRVTLQTLVRVGEKKAFLLRFRGRKKERPKKGFP